MDVRQTKQATAHAASAVPGPTVRAVVSLLIFVHLFCVLVALGANSEQVSQLHGRLAARLAFYTQTLNLEPPFSRPQAPMGNRNMVVPYYLTEGKLKGELEIVPEASGENADPQPLVLGKDQPHGSERRNRYERLGQLMAFHANVENNEGPPAVIAKSVARHMLVARGVRPLQVRVRMYTLPDWLGGVEPLEQPYPYTARVLIGDDNSVDVLKETPAQESATVETSSSQDP